MPDDHIEMLPATDDLTTAEEQLGFVEAHPARTPESAFVVAPRPTPHPYTGRALDRWKTVHRTFFVLTNFILVGLTQLETALGSDQTESGRAEVRAALLRLETLMLGSAVALRLAGDFAADAYGPQVRDDMAAYDPEFSGSLSADHARMIARMAVLKRVPTYAAAEHRRLMSAIDAVYRCHAGVCARFVGDERSLAQAKAATQPGAAQLMGPFRERAMRRAGCPVGAAPLTAETSDPPSSEP